MKEMTRRINMDKKKVKFWRGTRQSYNAILKAGLVDYWTRYSVKEPDGSWCEYFGGNVINVPTGQILPVNDVIEKLEDIKVFRIGDRYLVGHDGDEIIPADYKIYTIQLSEDQSGLSLETMVFSDKYTVRIKSKGMKAYTLVDSKLITYDEVDGGTF